MARAVTILGDGAWGTAMAWVLAQRPDREVRLLGTRPENTLLFQKTRENTRLLPGIRLPETVTITIDPEQAFDQTEAVFLAVPTQFIRPALRQFAPYQPPCPTPVVSLAKGIEIGTFLRPSEIVRQEWSPDTPVAILSGPSHAEEVARGLPAGVVVAASPQHPGLALWVQQAVGTDRFRVYSNDDPVGVELGGALKNVLGIAAGMADGLGLGDNAKSALITRGLAEMSRCGVALGAQARTFAGLAGMGDLLTTCFSPHGRNRQVGEWLARGETLATIHTKTPKIAEGITTAQALIPRLEQLGIEMPISQGVHAVLFEGMSPREAAFSLLMRQQRPEDES
ncbi:MAG: NAD(P)-dependent glycerol-3-phosphate dehydrogenase [Planctomycetota bacterium]|nr:NAD(P)-dependent glycerol-3-phosphate dehydrogenase [Planctomycetota bacterium]